MNVLLYIELYCRVLKDILENISQAYSSVIFFDIPRIGVFFLTFGSFIFETSTTVQVKWQEQFPSLALIKLKILQRTHSGLIDSEIFWTWYKSKSLFILALLLSFKYLLLSRPDFQQSNKNSNQEKKDVLKANKWSSSNKNHNISCTTLFQVHHFLLSLSEY